MSMTSQSFDSEGWWKSESQIEAQIDDLIHRMKNGNTAALPQLRDLHSDLREEARGRTSLRIYPHLPRDVLHAQANRIVARSTDLIIDGSWRDTATEAVEDDKSQDADHASPDQRPREQPVADVSLKVGDGLPKIAVPTFTLLRTADGTMKGSETMPEQEGGVGEHRSVTEAAIGGSSLPTRALSAIDSGEQIGNSATDLAESQAVQQADGDMAQSEGPEREE